MSEGDSFTRPELGNDTEGRGAVAVCSEGLLRGHVLAGGPASHACRRRSGSTRGFNFLFWGFFHTLRSDCTPPCGGAGEEVFVLGDSFAGPEVGNDRGRFGAGAGGISPPSSREFRADENPR